MYNNNCKKFFKITKTMEKKLSNRINKTQPTIHRGKNCPLNLSPISYVQPSKTINN